MAGNVSIVCRPASWGGHACLDDAFFRLIRPYKYWVLEVLCSRCGLHPLSPAAALGLHLHLGVTVWWHFITQPTPYDRHGMAWLGMRTVTATLQPYWQGSYHRS